VKIGKKKAVKSAQKVTVSYLGIGGFFLPLKLGLIGFVFRIAYCVLRIALGE